MGHAHRAIKQYPEAIAAYKKYIALDPTGRVEEEIRADDARKAISELSTTQPANK